MTVKDPAESVGFGDSFIDAEYVSNTESDE